MIFGVLDADAAPLLVPWSHKDAQLKFVIQALTGAEAGVGALGSRTGLAHGARELLAGDANGGGTAMVANGNPLVIGQKRVVRAELLADCRGVMQGDVEVGVVPDPGRYVVLDGGAIQKQRFQL